LLVDEFTVEWVDADQLVPKGVKPSFGEGPSWAKGVEGRAIALNAGVGFDDDQGELVGLEAWLGPAVELNPRLPGDHEHLATGSVVLQLNQVNSDAGDDHRDSRSRSQCSYSTRASAFIGWYFATSPVSRIRCRSKISRSS